MNANIFEFKNNEILMQFNPLFLPTNNIVDNSGNLRTFKLSNSSYLFSDIIKVFVGGDLTQNLLGTGQSSSQKNISNENIFSFNIGKNNNQISDTSLNGLKTSIIELINKLSLLGQINPSKKGNLNKSTDLNNEELFTSNGLKILLDKLINSLNNNKLPESNEVNKNLNNDLLSKEKNENNDEVKKLISKILSSLNTGKPVIINIIGNQENLKLEIGKIDIQTLRKTTNNLENIDEGISKNKIGESLSKGFLEPNSGLTAIGSSTNLSEFNDANAKVKQNGIEITGNIRDNLNVSENKNQLKILLENSRLTDNDSKTNLTGDIKETASNLLQNESNSLKNGNGTVSPENVSQTILNTGKTGNGKIIDYVKSFNQDKDFNKPELFGLKLKITGTEKASSEINSNIKHDILKGSINQSSDNTKNLQDSLSIEKLMASKSNMKAITEVSNKSNSTQFSADNRNIKTGTDNIIKIQQDNVSGNNQLVQNEEFFIPENDLKVINNKLFNGNEISVKIENDKSVNNIAGQKLNSSAADNLQSISEQVNEQKAKLEDPLKLEDQRNQSPIHKENASNQTISKGNTQFYKIEPAQESKIGTEKNNEIQIPVKENDKISNNRQDSKTNSVENIKTENPGKITTNEASPENSFNESLETNNQNTQGNSKDQNQFSQSRGENLFSSYINKIELSSVQNVKKPVYFDDISEQMKKIDASEIVKEISKLASSKDQKNVVLKLMPDSLGKVKISLDINKNVIHAHAEVENEAARSLMQNNIENLKQSLVQQGMQLNSLNISLSNQQEQKSSKSFQSKRKPVYSEQVKKIDEKENINVSKHYGYNTYEFLA